MFADVPLNTAELSMSRKQNAELFSNRNGIGEIVKLTLRNCGISVLLSVICSGAFAENSTELPGTAWRLVKIMSMDDKTLTPEASSKYTLNFGNDGRASIVADCNTGNGSWSSPSNGDLQFSAIASTHALCPPGSVSEQYLSQFEWVRSYVIKDLHLFLSTMADGAIIEFEPLAP